MKLLRSIVFFFLSLNCIVNEVFSKSPLTLSTADTAVTLPILPVKNWPQKDLNDILRYLLGNRNKSAMISKVDSTPFKIFPSVLPGFGYTQLTGPSVVCATNFSSYLSDASTTKLSSVFFNAEKAWNKQSLINLNINLWTKNNRLNIVSDNRFYKYNIKDYGLGSYSDKARHLDIEYDFIKLHTIVNRQVAPDIFMGFGQNLDLHSNIKIAPSNRPPLKAMDQVANLNKTISSGIELVLLMDKRVNSNQPIAGGTYLNLVLRKNFHFFGSNYLWHSIFIDYRKYIAIDKRSPKWYKPIIAVWGYGNFTYGNTPYLDMPSTMWDEFDNSGRPYIQGRFRGKKMMYFESEFRWLITKNGLIGGGLFINAQSMNNNSMKEFKRILPGFGGSLRIQTNKSSRVNYVISYGLGVHHERGLFFTLAEIF